MENKEKSLKSQRLKQGGWAFERVNGVKHMEGNCQSSDTRKLPVN